MVLPAALGTVVPPLHALLAAPCVAGPLALQSAATAAARCDKERGCRFGRACQSKGRPCGTWGIRSACGGQDEGMQQLYGYANVSLTRATRRATVHVIHLKYMPCVCDGCVTARQIWKTPVQHNPPGTSTPPQSPTYQLPALRLKDMSCPLS
jgi:hypothetical protein